MAAAGFDEDTGFRLNGWASVNIVAELAGGLDEVTGPTLWEALNAATSVPTGVTPPLQWQTAPVEQLPRVFNWCALITEVEGGEEVPLTGTFLDTLTGEECETPS